MTQCKGFAIFQDEPTTKIQNLGIPTDLFSRMGVYGTLEAGRKKRAFNRRVYNTLRSMSTAENNPQEMRIMQFQPAIDWSLVWGNLHNVRLSDGNRSAWYMVIHDIIPTNAKLHRIRLMDTDKCT